MSRRQHQNAQEEMAGNANPPIEFKADHAAVVCVLHPAVAPDAPDLAPNEALTKLQTTLLEEVARNPGISYRDLASSLERNETTIMRNLQKLKKAGILQRTGSHKAGQWVILKRQKT